MKKFCRVCGIEISEGRLKALPDTNTCTEHSRAEKKLGFRIITGKNTYSELDIVDAKSFNTLNQYDRKNNTASHMRGINKKRIDKSDESK